jgi:hypothetical protein
VGYTEIERGGTGFGKGNAIQDGHGVAGTGVWDRYVWMSCADGKVRRAPDDSVSLVDGLHRSVLGALGNSIVPQVAAEVIGTIVKSEAQF